MKNKIFDLKKRMSTRMAIVFFLFVSQITIAQVDPSSFTVTGTNGSCLSNASVKVTVPTGNYNLGWVAHIWKGTTFTQELPVPVTGGDIVFNSLTPGTYNIELTDYTTKSASTTVTLTTSYTDFALGYSYKLPSASCPGATDGELTVKVLSGGAGPFKYDVSYPTPAPGTGTTTQTYTGPESNHTFLNVPGGITVNYTVTDLVGGSVGCENSKTQNPTLGSTTVSTVNFYGYSLFNFVRTSKDKCDNPTLYVNLVNVDPTRDAIISAAGNATVEIKDASGADKGTWPLTRLSSIRYMYNAAAVGGPELENNWTVNVKINWGCAILERTSTVVVGNDWVNHAVKYAINASCTVDYIWYLLAGQDKAGNRNMYFLEDNHIRFEKWNGTTWEAVPSTDVTPDPATMYNPMGVLGAHTWTTPSANGQFTFKNPGNYRYTVSDDCHSVSNTFVFNPKTNPINEVTVVQSKSVLQGTSGIKITIGTPLTPDFKMKIRRKDGLTSIPFTATGPLNMAGSYTATFPKEATITSTTSVGGYWDFSDLPLGDYIVELSDGCGSTRTVNIMLDQPAEYTSTFTPVLSCTGSNKITYNLGQNANAYVVGTANLYTDNGLGAPGTSIATLTGTSGTFSNLNAGDYVVAYEGVGAGLSSVSGVTYLKTYYQKVKIISYGGIEIETSSVMCDPSYTNSGIVNVELVNHDVLTPTTIKLFSASSPTTPIQNKTLGVGETGTIFTEVPIGDYFVRVTNDCTSIDKNISINATGTTPIAKVNRSKVCEADKTIKLAITASNSLYDVIWTDLSNTVVGNVTPLTLTNPTNTTYTATFKLKSGLGCANVEEYTSSVDVVVTADPDLTSPVVSDVDLCLNNSRNFTISNTQAGFKYELTDKDGVSYATPIYSAESTGGTITMTIPSGIALAAGNTFKIKAISGGCSGFLTDVVSITSKQNKLDLDVISPTGMICLGTASTLTIKATELGVTYTIKKNGVTIISGTGTGSDIDFTIPANQLTAGTNEFIISTSGTGCQNGDLVQRGIINVNTAPVISGVLTPIIEYGCDAIVAPAAYSAVAQLEAKGVTITDETADASLTVTYTDSAITGTTTTKYITRTYTIKDSCNKSTTVIQNIVLNITTPIAPTISAATATTFCQGGSVVLTSSATTGNQWYRNGVIIHGETSPTYTATQSGTYTVIVTNNFNCPSPASNGKLVTVNTLPVATINNDVLLEFVNCNVTTTNLTASLGSHYVWYYSDDNVNPYTQTQGDTQTITVSALGFYKVKVIDPNCEATSQVTRVVAAPSVSSLTNQLETCVGNTITLNANAASFENPTYQWKKDGTDIPGASTLNLVVTEDGEYTVSVTDGRTVGNIGTQTSCGANVKFNPLPVVNAGADFTITCITNPTGLTIGETSETGFNYAWTSSTNDISGLSNAAIANPLANPTVNTTYTIRKTNQTTGCWQEDSITITVDRTAPTANAGADFTRTCINNTSGKEIGIAPISGVTYSWSPATGLDNASIANPNANPETTQTYTLTVTNVSNGCFATDTVVATIDVSAPTANTGTNFTKTCVANTSGKEIGAAAVSGVTYSWLPTTGLDDATKANPIANPSATTTYTLTATKTATGCTATGSVLATVDVSTPTAHAGADFTRTCINNTSGKEIGIAPISGVTYSWSPATGLDNASIANPSANPETTQTYTLTVTNVSNGCFATDTVVATIDVSAPTANAGTDFTKTCATNSTGKLIGAAAVSGETYSWSPLTGLDNPTTANPNANPLVTTEYTLTVTKTATGCTATDSVIVTVLDTPNPIALSTTIANNCPVETVDLTTIQPPAVSGIVYEWWTGTATTRVTQITNPTTYSTLGTIYLWSKTASEGCYNAIASEVNMIKNVCCMTTVGEIVNTTTLSHFAPADITSLQHINYPTSSVVRYVVVNDLDGKIKQINTTKPEFTQLKAGKYTVHALVFGPTVVPTGLVAGNKLSQVQPLCGTSATFALVVQSICSSKTSYTETLSNTQQYALLDVATNKFVQVNTNGTFTMIHTGMPHQVIGFNYTGTATGIQVGGTIAGVTATNLDITAGSIISGCTAVITQIDGNVYNDKDKKCIEGLNGQTGLPNVSLYAKLLDSNNQVIYVSPAIQSPEYTFSMSPDLLDGTYSIILDDNEVISDAVATYPNSWKGNAQTFTVASGQIVEQLSNTANFVPMCMQAATNKPILKPMANLVGNTYNYCQGTIASSLSVDAISGATVHWYTQATGGTAKSVAPIPNTTVVGTTTCYVSQSVNGAESDRTEVIIVVHALPEQPTAISGNNLIAAGSIQSYSVVDNANSQTYNWILPTDWTGTSTSKDINVAVGNQAATIGVTAISPMGCVSPVQELAVRVVIEDDIEVYNSLSPNGDGDNDIFRIRNIDFYPENTMSIYNRWGIEVYSVISYGQKDNFFKGFSDGRSTLSRGVELPEGTYFYMLTYKNTKGIEKNLSGYLYIKQ